MESNRVTDNNATQAGSGGAPNPPTIADPSLSLDKVKVGKRERDAEDEENISKKSKLDGSEMRLNQCADTSKVRLVPFLYSCTLRFTSCFQKEVAGNAGSSCHQCKSRRSLQDLIFCTNIVDKKNKHCRKKYCDGCLKKFYKERDGVRLQPANNKYEPIYVKNCDFLDLYSVF